MKNKNRICLLVIILILTTALISILYVRFDHEEVKIEAASAFYPFTTKLAEEIYGKDYSKDMINTVSTSKAYEDILSGKADIVVATKPSSEQEEMIKNSNVNLKFEKLYFEPLAILVNKNNDIDSLSLDEIKDIYFGNDSKWNTYQLEKNNGSQTCFESIVKDNRLDNNHFEIKTMPEIVDRIGNDEKSIGYSFYTYCAKMHINKNTKMINVNNKDVKDKDYPLLFEVYLIYNEDNKHVDISRIINWIKTQKGQEIINNIK